MINVVEENLVKRIISFVRRLPRSQIIDIPELLLADSGWPTAHFNKICRLNTHGIRLEESVILAVRHFTAQMRPAAWLLGPRTGLEYADDTLCQNGFQFIGDETAMCLNIEKYHTTPSQVVGLNILKARTAPDLGDFATVLASSLSRPDIVIRAVYAEVFDDFNGNQEIHLVGRAGERAVATAEVYLDGAVAGIYSVATLASHRGRGFGNAMTKAAINEAKQHGAKIAVLHASNMGRSLYERLGFEAVGLLREYIWFPGVNNYKGNLVEK